MNDAGELLASALHGWFDGGEQVDSKDFAGTKWNILKTEGELLLIPALYSS